MRKLRIITGMLVLTGAFWLAGCGGGDDTGNEMEPEENPAEESGSMEQESMEGGSMESEDGAGSSSGQ